MDEGRIPTHVAIIMDGNGRWAVRRGLSRAEGHRAGVRALRRVVEISRDLGIRYLTVYGFSTENWRRPKEEVDLLMDLLVEYLRSEVQELKEKGVRLNVIGHIEELPDRCQSSLSEALAITQENSDLVLTLALNYGGRREIVDAAKTLATNARTGSLEVSAISEELFGRLLSTGEMPDPDLIIRPSGEWRLSNFLLWQAAYSEFYMTSVLWPEFGEPELRAAVAAFGARDRRYGGLREGEI